MKGLLNYLMFILLWILSILLKNEYPQVKKLVTKIQTKNYLPNLYESWVLLIHIIGGFVLICLTIQITFFGIPTV